MILGYLAFPVGMVHQRIVLTGPLVLGKGSGQFFRVSLGVF